MKNRQILIIVLILYMLLWNGMDLISHIQEHKETIHLLNQIDSLLQQNHYLDSLYYDHLKDCSYIMRTDVKVGYRGTLYSEYHRKYNIP